MKKVKPFTDKKMVKLNAACISFAAVYCLVWFAVDAPTRYIYDGPKQLDRSTGLDFVDVYVVVSSALCMLISNTTSWSCI